jgi:hypothetical protein
MIRPGARRLALLLVERSPRGYASLLTLFIIVALKTRLSFTSLFSITVLGYLCLLALACILPVIFGEIRIPSQRDISSDDILLGARIFRTSARLLDRLDLCSSDRSLSIYRL